MENIHENIILTLKVVILLPVFIAAPALYILIKWYCIHPIDEETLPINEAQGIIQNSSILSE